MEEALGPRLKSNQQQEFLCLTKSPTHIVSLTTLTFLMKGRFLIKRRFNWSETPLKVFIGGEFLVICLGHAAEGHKGESQEAQRVPTAQLEVGDEKDWGTLEEV